MFSQWIPYTFGLVLFLETFGMKGFATEHEILFDQALEKFKVESYNDAIESFQKLLEREPSNETILFNLGLSYGRTQREGVALAYLRKASWLHPNSHLIRDALDFFEKKNPSLSRQRTFLESLQDRLRRWPYEIFVVLSGLAFLYAGWHFVSYLKTRETAEEEGALAPSWPLRSIFSLILCVFLLGGMGLKLNDEFQMYATVIESTEVRSGPNERFAAVSELIPGTEIQVKKIQNDWIQIVMSRGWTGWVLRSKIFLTSGRSIW